MFFKRLCEKQKFKKMQGVFILVLYIVGVWMVLKGLSKLVIIALNKFQMLSTEIQTKGSKIVVGEKEIYTYIKSGVKFELVKENGNVKIKLKKK